jgi:dTDP-4-dehydrorhamnose 3,5-epimerase
MFTMKITETKIPEVKHICPTLFEDERGFFLESYHQEKFAKAGIHDTFIQDNHSKSVKGTLRGLHMQVGPHGQGKLVRATRGTIFDVAVDVRPHSPTFKQWVGFVLSEENKEMLYIPPDFAHGFYVMSESAELQYKCTQLYNPAAEKSLRYDDPSISINWPIEGPLLLSDKDRQALSLSTFLA